MSKVRIVYTLNFTDSFISARDYIQVKLQSPKAADDFVSGVITSIDRASHTPHIAVKRLTSLFLFPFCGIIYSIKTNAEEEAARAIHKSKDVGRLSH